MVDDSHHGPDALAPLAVPRRRQELRRRHWPPREELHAPPARADRAAALPPRETARSCARDACDLERERATSRRHASSPPPLDHPTVGTWERDALDAQDVHLATKLKAAASARQVVSQTRRAEKAERELERLTRISALQRAVQRLAAGAQRGDGRGQQEHGADYTREVRDAVGADEGASETEGRGLLPVDGPKI